MYKLFAFLFFIAITLVGIAAIAPHDSNNLIESFNSLILLFSLLVYFFFTIYVLINSIFKVKVKVFNKLFGFFKSLKDNDIVVIVLNIIYYVLVLTLSLFLLFTVFYYSFFYFFKDSSSVLQVFLNDTLKNTTLNTNVKEIETQNNSLTEKLDTLDVKLHARAYEDFFSKNQKEYVVHDDDYDYKLEYSDYDKNSDSLENTYNYKFIIQKASNSHTVKDADLNDFLYVISQDTDIKNISAKNLGQLESDGLPVILFSINTSDGNRLYLLAPKHWKSKVLKYHPVKCEGASTEYWSSISIVDSNETGMVLKGVRQEIYYGKSHDWLYDIDIDPSGEITCRTVDF